MNNVEARLSIEEGVNPDNHRNGGLSYNATVTSRLALDTKMANGTKCAETY